MRYIILINIAISIVRNTPANIRGINTSNSINNLWCYTKKVDKKRKTRYNRIKRQEEKEMAGKKSPRYSEEFKKTIVNLH
ncbi:MAG: hypothetical protein IJ421_10070, partial [Prevotella sp.]|nr:hypothetical protein [Prevotella sp.]